MSPPTTFTRVTTIVYYPFFSCSYFQGSDSTSAKTRMNCFRYQKLMSQKCYGLGKKILFKKQLFDLEVKVPRRSLWYVTHHLMVMHPHTKYH